MSTVRTKFLETRGLDTATLSSEDRYTIASDCLSANPPDLNSAFLLFDPLIDKDHGAWLQTLGTIYFEENFDFYDPKKAVKFCELACAKGYNAYAKFLTSIYLFGWYGIKPDSSKALHYSQSIDKNDQGDFYVLSSAFAVVADTFDYGETGIGQRLSKAKSAIEKISNRNYCGCADCQGSLKSLNSALDSGKSDTFKKSQMIIKRVIDEKIDIEEAYDITSKLGITESLNNMLRILKHRAKRFDTEDYDYWHHLSVYVDVRGKNQDPNQVIENTFNYGPSYNAIGKNALPIAGELWSAFHGGENDASIINPGYGFIEQVIGDASGDVKFKFKKSPNALVFDDDLDILLVLSFCYKNHVFPSIDVPSADSLNLGSIREKKTEPQWLINTDLGRTLYATDVFAGELSWGMEEFDTVDENNGSNVSTFNKLRELILGCEGENPEGLGYSPVVNVNPKKVSLSKPTVKKVANGSETSIDVFGLSFGVDGGFSKSKSIRGTQWKYRNSDKYLHTKRTKILTEHYNEVAMVFPVYERLRQLMSISYALKELRKSGFAPSEKMMARLNQRKAHFEEKTKKVGGIEYAMYLPLIHKPKG